MKCPAELACELRANQFRDRRGSASTVECHRLWLELLYFALCRVLVAPPRMKGGREPAIEVALAEALLVLAPLVGDPKGVYSVCSAHLHFVDLLKGNDVSAHLTEAAAATVAAATVAGLPANRLAELELLCGLAAKRRRDAAQTAELDALAAKVEAGMGQFDAMNEEEQRRFADQVGTLARRSRRFAHPPKLPSVTLRVRRGRARRPSRRAAHRPSPRRAESDSGGDGDGDGPGDGEPPPLTRLNRLTADAAPGGSSTAALVALDAGGANA